MPSLARKRIKPAKPPSAFDKLLALYEMATDFAWRLLFDVGSTKLMGRLLLILETFLCIGVVQYVKYTEIDWGAYMQQVDGFVNGTYDYTKLEGGTGPLVYPAGHLYIYTILYYLTSSGLHIRLAQYMFVAIYLCNLTLVFSLYQRARLVPPFVLIFMCLAAHRIHSIYMLRLFNDPIAVLFLHLTLLCFLKQKWTLGCFVYSFACGIKMNILLYAPAVAALLVAQGGYLRAFMHILCCALVQVGLALPFLRENPLGYVKMSFNFGRQFLFEWTVNWRFLPEWLFANRLFHAGLLSAHLVVLVVFASHYWFRPRRDLMSVARRKEAVWCLSARDILFPMLTANFIGIMFSRTLHYQFYVWYFYSLPYLLWNTDYGTVSRLLVWGLMEFCWNTFPSTVYSSALLHLCHVCILVGIVRKWNRFRLPFAEVDVEEHVD